MTNKNHYFIDVHVLQTVPPSCVNRDDTGSPKTAVYGGATRARVSSQAWKHAMRLMFRDSFDPEQLGSRTKLVVDLVKNEILKLNAELTEEVAEKQAVKVLEAAGLLSEENPDEDNKKSTGKKPKKSTDKKGKKNLDALFFISTMQVRALAALAVDDNFEKGVCKAALAEAPSVDMVLFGRMLAKKGNKQLFNIDAAAQVAHSISTHAVHNEYDFFTAVDDCAPDDQTGAAHLDTAEFNSATLYRYATVSLEELYRSLGTESATTVRGFLDAFIRAMPTGKQNTFANRTLPDAVYVTIRNDQPVNLCGAFEKPVRSGTEGYVAESEKRLISFAQETYSTFAAEPIAAFAVGSAMAPLADPVPLTALLDQVENWVKEQLSDCEVK